MAVAKLQAVKNVAAKAMEAVVKEFWENVDFFYHYILLHTPIDFEWEYRRDRYNDIQIVKLYDEEYVEIARFNAESRILVISGAQSTSKFYVEEDVSLTKIEKKILKYYKIENKNNPFLGKNFVLISYERIFDDIEAPEILNSDDFGWHIRDERVWLEGPGAKVYCKMSLDGSMYKFLNNDWREVTHKNEESFRRHIERAVQWGHKKA